MEIENSFEVPAPPANAWALLTDVPAVLPCMPGAELLEVTGEDSWKAAVSVKLGPIALRFLADIRRQEVDEQARRILLAIDAREAKGRGSARATIDSSASPTPAGTRVDIRTDLTLQGAVAQHGRGVVSSVAAGLTEEFAKCLTAKLAGATSETAADQAPVKQLSGLRLLITAVWRSWSRRR